MPQFRRLTDSARAALKVVDEHGSGWEGGTMRDNRSEVRGRIQDVEPPPTPAKQNGMTLLVVAGVALLIAAWG